ncbi:hypothetical protein RI129_013045 [Pyrocoelia pectoralis]|uniref:PHD-type domain-containing protein n=1 Tax=Pyrocoelia pectoralis TaxID=417401 RepID=A0AAN7Z782_9COLE
MKRSHANFDSEVVGLCLNPQYPHFGASPDGLVSCDCCDMGVVEIKCPYCAKDIGLDDLNVLKRVGMQKLKLNYTHPYYYQVQMQLAITGVNYCDFVVWSSKNAIYERILFDDEFWQKESAIATKFFNIVIMPELLGKFYTTKEVKNAVSSDWSMFKELLNTEPEVPCNTNSNICDSNEFNTEVGCSTNVSVYCLCKGPDDGTPMIACCNLNCSVEWFHLSCVGLTYVPNLEWYCSSCMQ